MEVCLNAGFTVGTILFILGFIMFAGGCVWGCYQGSDSLMRLLLPIFAALATIAAGSILMATICPNNVRITSPKYVSAAKIYFEYDEDILDSIDRGVSVSLPTSDIDNIKEIARGKTNCCGNCGKKNVDAKFCPNCGQEIQNDCNSEVVNNKTKYCPECGTKSNGTKFCSNCGHRNK